MVGCELLISSFLVVGRGRQEIMVDESDYSEYFFIDDPLIILMDQPLIIPLYFQLEIFAF